MKRAGYWYRLPSDPDPAPGWTKWLLVALVVAVFALACLLLDGCHHDRPPVKPLPPITIVRSWTSCLETPPPAAPAFAPLPNGDPRCAAPLVACFERDSAAALQLYLADLETWSKSAWARCSQTTEE